MITFCAELYKNYILENTIPFYIWITQNQVFGIQEHLDTFLLEGSHLLTLDLRTDLSLPQIELQQPNIESMKNLSRVRKSETLCLEYSYFIHLLILEDYAIFISVMKGDIFSIEDLEYSDWPSKNIYKSSLYMRIQISRCSLKYFVPFSSRVTPLFHSFVASKFIFTSFFPPSQDFMAIKTIFKGTFMEEPSLNILRST